MSALTLLSVIAPAVPSVPQGSSDEAASGFRNLLAALSGTDEAASIAKSPAEPTKSDEVQLEAEADAPAVAGFLTVPTPLVLAAAEEATPTTVAAPAGTATDQDETQARAALLADKASTSKANEPEVLPREQTTTPLPADKASTSKANEPEVLLREQTMALLLPDKGQNSKPPRPEVQPPLPVVRPLASETPEIELTLAETAAVTQAAEARVRTSAAPTTLTPTPSVPPPPLRPLAERTSRSPGPLEARTVDGSRSADPARSTPTIGTSTPAIAANPAAGPADLAAAAVARDVANGSETEGPPPEPLPSTGENATTQTQAAAGARETGVSQLSRATIEATAQIAAQILRRLEGRSTRFEMALTPDELGRVDVKLDIDSEGRLNARLAFDNPAAATDFRGRADELRRQLEDAGFHLAEDAFEFADRDSGSSAFDRGQDTRNGSSRAFAAASRLNTEIDVAQPPRWLALSLAPSGVDMKV